MVPGPACVGMNAFRIRSWLNAEGTDPGPCIRVQGSNKDSLHCRGNNRKNDNKDE